MEMKQNKILLIGIIVFILVIGFIIFSAFVEHSFVVKESYIDIEPYQSTTWENYVISAKKCDVVSNCWCIHKNFWGTCDSCQCQRQIEITRHKSVEKERDVTIYCTLLEKLRGKCILQENYKFAKIN